LRSIGIAALGPKPRTKKPVPRHKIFPYLLRGLAIERPNQISCADITYIPIGRGFLYLVAMQPDIRRSERPRIQVRDWSRGPTDGVHFTISQIENLMPWNYKA
jgi:transposase InsO family protein